MAEVLRQEGRRQRDKHHGGQRSHQRDGRVEPEHARDCRCAARGRCAEGEHADLAVSVQVGAEPALLDALVEGRLDAALTARTQPRAGLAYEPVFAEELVLVSAYDVTRKTLFAGGKVRLLSFHEGCPYRAIAENWLRRQGLEIEETTSFGTFGAILSCAAAGMGLAILPKTLSAEHVRRKELRAHAFDDLKRVTTYLVTLEESEVPEVDVLRATLRRRASAAKPGVESSVA